MKKVAVIQDLSFFWEMFINSRDSGSFCHGCAGMYPLPTAVLSAQTGFPSFYCEDFTSKMNNLVEWNKLNVTFDEICTRICYR